MMLGIAGREESLMKSIEDHPLMEDFGKDQCASAN
jgi:hypothetical protein